MLSVRIFLVSVVVTFPGTWGHAQDTRPTTAPSPQPAAATPRWKLMAEVGLRSLEGSPWQKIARFVADEIAQADLPYAQVFRETLSKVEPGCLPIRAQIFHTSGAAVVPCFLVVLDSAAALDIAWIRAKIGPGFEPVGGLENTWEHESGLLLRQLPPTDGRHRILGGNFTIAQARQLSSRIPLPGRRQRKILAELRTARCYAFMDIGGPPTVIGIRETQDRPTVDVIYGLEGATGALALFLPREPGEAKLVGMLPFEPDVLGLLDLGPSTQRTVDAALGILAGKKDAPPWAARTREVARCWTGTAALYGQVVGKKLRGGMVLGIEKDSGKEAAPAVKEILRLLEETDKDKGQAEPVAPDMGAGRKLRWERGCSKVEAKGGLLVWALGPDEEYCRNFTAKVQARQGEHALPERFRTANGPLQVLVKARLWQQFRQLHDEATKDEAKAEGPYAAGQRLARRIRDKGLDFIKDDVVLTATWDRHWMRLRIQF